MPLDSNGKVVCITHNTEFMLRNPGYHIINEVEKRRDGGLTIFTSNGMPIISFVCKICGYVEHYAAMIMEEWRIKKLYVKCKNDQCKREFFSPIQCPENGFETIHLESNSYQCYYCNQKNLYDKKDHFYK